MRRHARVLFAVAALASFFAFASVASAEFEPTGAFSGPGSGDGQADNPGRAAVEQSSANLFVVDSGNNRVQVFKPNGSGSADYLTQFGNGQLSEPWGIAIDENAGQTFVYVADSKNNRIVKYASDEAATPGFTIDGSFSSPAKGSGAGQVGSFHAALAIDPTTHDLLVADPGNNRVARFSATGTPGASFDGSAGVGSPGAFTNLLDVAVSTTGDVYVIDADGPDIRKRQGTSRALRYSAAGSYEAELTPVGAEQRPATVAVNPANDEVTVSGQQAAVFEDLSPTIHFFDSADTPLSSRSLEAQYDTVTGLAIAPGARTHLYVVLDNGFFTYPPDQEVQYGSPLIKRYGDFRLPGVAIKPVAESSITRTEAELTGSVNPDGFATEWHFEYSSDGGGSWTSTSSQNAGAGSSAISVSAAVSGLQAGATYQVRLVAANSEGTKTSATQSFATDLAVKEVKTEPATSLTATSATLNGSIVPGGVGLSECKFEYGSTEALGQTTPCAEATGAIGSGEAPVPVHVDVGGLSVGIYYFRLVATNSFGTTEGSLEQVAIPGPPVILSQSAGPEVFRAVLKARINPGNKATSYRFEYGTTASYGQSTEEATIAAGNDPVKVAQEIKELQPDTTYHYRVVVVNGVAEVFGSDQTFATDVAPGSGSCPNAQIRAEQGSTHLPECRAYEQISPRDKLGKGLLFFYQFGISYSTAVAPDGSAATFESQGAYADATSAFTTIDYVSRRGESGWSTHAITSKDYLASENPGYEGGLSVAIWSDDLSKVGVFADDLTDNPLAPGAGPASDNLYLNDLTNNSFQALTLDPGPPAVPSGDTESLAFAGGSTDFSTAVFEDGTPHTANAPLGVTNPYAWHEGQLELVSILPDPDGAGSLIGGPAPQGAIVGAGARNSQMGKNPVSDDGSRIVFTTPDGRIYVRENGSTTVEVSASQKAVPDAQMPARFSMATPDGRYVFFSTEESLLDSDTNPGSDLYRYDVETGALVRISPSGVITPLGASDDGSYVYFDAGNVYLWHDGQVEQVGEGRTQQDTAQVTPDGAAIAFQSGQSQPLTGEDPWVGGASQVLLYDADADTLRCVSCRRDGGEPTGGATMPSYRQGIKNGANPSAVEPRAISDDGERVFFTSPDPLVAADVNERFDAYEYVNGRQYLLSGGISNADSFVFNATPSGSDVYFISVDQLAPGDGDHSTDLYTARINGGFPEPAPRLPCTGEACKSGTTSPPPPTGVATPQFSGPGNADQRAAQKKAKKKKKQKKKARNKKKAKKRASKSKGASKRSVGK